MTLDEKEFNQIMSDTCCMMCGTRSEAPYEGAVVVSRTADVVSFKAVCGRCFGILASLEIEDTTLDDLEK